jgi:sirohydrochlorin ferrochelatase
MASTTHELARDAWRPYFDELSRHLGTVEATVEVAGRDLGAQIAAERLVLRGISYDHKDDVLVIVLERGPEDREDYEHMVNRPQRIYVATGEGAEMTIDVEDGEGHQTLVHIERPEALPDLG